jgi:hypothetical protein
MRDFALGLVLYGSLFLLFLVLFTAGFLAGMRFTEYVGVGPKREKPTTWPRINRAARKKEINKLPNVPPQEVDEQQRDINSFYQ